MCCGISDPLLSVQGHLAWQKLAEHVYMLLKREPFLLKIDI